MIMPKSRETTIRRAPASTRHTSDRALLQTDGEVIQLSEKPSFRISGDSIELTFRLPMNEGTKLAATLGAERASGAGDSHGSTDADARRPVDAARPDMPTLRTGDLLINPGRHEVLYKGTPLPQLTFTEFGILHHLASHPGWVFNRQQIVAGVRGEDYPVTDRAVDVQVAGLRKKLGAAAVYVQTVRGVGYRFKG